MFYNIGCKNTNKRAKKYQARLNISRRVLTIFAIHRKIEIY